MEVYIILTLVIISIILGICMHQRDKQKLNQFLEKQARRLNGKVVKGFLLAPPQIRYSVDGTEARLTVMDPGTSSTRSGVITVLDFAVACPDRHEMRIIEKRNAFQSALDSAIPWQNEIIASGNPSFDERFEVRATSPVTAARIFNDGDLIRSCLELPAGADICLKNGRCTISVDGYRDSDELVDSMSAIAARLSGILRNA